MPGYAGDVGTTCAKEKEGEASIKPVVLILWRKRNEEIEKSNRNRA